MYRLPHCGELDVERRAFARGRANIYLSCVLLGDSVAHRKSQTSASTTSCGGKERIENPVNVLPRNPRSCIHDFDFHAPILRARSHFKDAARGHRVTRIQEKIQEYLLQLVR